MDRNGSFRIVRLADFHPYSADRDPTATSTAIYN